MRTRPIGRVPSLALLPLMLALSGLVSGCTTISSTVEVFQELPADYQGASIAILPGDEKKANSLEFKTYGQKLATRLNEAGFDVVEKSLGPRFVAFLGYAAGEGQQITSTYSIPQFGITGYSSSQTHATLNTYGSYGTYSGSTTYNPTYGVTGYTTGVTVDTVYPRAVVVDIYEINWAHFEASLQVYHLMISSAAGCGNFSQVIDEMLEAGFQQFPAPSGSANEIDLPVEGDC